ncbi:MAG TPA: FUSC family protein [Nocardioidaceae bacterium]|nr:FUSC family protein [Nocardioidaceae bacterium]
MLREPVESMHRARSEGQRVALEVRDRHVSSSCVEDDRSVDRGGPWRDRRSSDDGGGTRALFVCRFAYHESVHAAYSRIVATVLSFVLCMIYLLIFPFSPIGLAVIIGVGTVILKLFGHEQEIVTAGITTAVIMVIAAPSPNPWEEPILRLADTLLGIGVGLAAVWLVRGPIKSARDAVPESGV